ncbi:hypothetical protein F2Q69_00050171 [Brassica cretica]|uniref:DUF1985 domain-containing protein n=1 Tax=Brassica cretica TaxID=69181 RepID=A0A8S9Q167_BRACR|nr:hypothetical protein F2Q69_00050171 [Brassica cretica]
MGRIVWITQVLPRRSSNRDAQKKDSEEPRDPIEICMPCVCFSRRLISPRIIPELVEMIRDLEEFLAFPWGRVAFEMLVTGIKKKDEILLSQTSVALPGFLDAIQLVFMEAVPQIKEVVPQPEPVVVIESDSESETECGDSQADEEEDEAVIKPATPPAAVRYCVNPAHVKALDEDEKAQLGR